MYAGANVCVLFIWDDKYVRMDVCIYSPCIYVSVVVCLFMLECMHACIYKHRCMHACLPACILWRHASIAARFVHSFFLVEVIVLCQCSHESHGFVVMGKWADFFCKKARYTCSSMHVFTPIYMLHISACSNNIVPDDCMGFHLLCPQITVTITCIWFLKFHLVRKHFSCTNRLHLCAQLDTYEPLCSWMGIYGPLHS